MTGTMTERVARAIYASFGEGHPDDWEERDGKREYAWEAAIPQARAAIEAMREDDLKRLLARRKFDQKYTVAESGCWIWTGALDRRDGYGRFYDGVSNVAAYAFAYEFENGPVPSGMVLDHLCRERRCVNPTHLRIVTNAENVLAGTGVTARNAVATHCKKGHELSGSNLYVRPDGYRTCRTCQGERSRTYKAKRRAMIDAALQEENDG